MTPVHLNLPHHVCGGLRISLLYKICISQFVRSVFLWFKCTEIDLVCDFARLITQEHVQLVLNESDGGEKIRWHPGWGNFNHFSLYWYRFDFLKHVFCVAVGVCQCVCAKDCGHDCLISVQLFHASLCCTTFDISPLRPKGQIFVTPSVSVVWRVHVRQYTRSCVFVSV